MWPHNTDNQNNKEYSLSCPMRWIWSSPPHRIQWLSKVFATQESKKETKKAVTNATTAMSPYHPISPVIKLCFRHQGKKETMNFMIPIQGYSSVDQNICNQWHLNVKRLPANTKYFQSTGSWPWEQFNKKATESEKRGESDMSDSQHWKKFMPPTGL